MHTTHHDMLARIIAVSNHIGYLKAWWSHPWERIKTTGTAVIGTYIKRGTFAVKYNWTHSVCSYTFISVTPNTCFSRARIAILAPADEASSDPGTDLSARAIHLAAFAINIQTQPCAKLAHLSKLTAAHIYYVHDTMLSRLHGSCIIQLPVCRFSLVAASGSSEQCRAATQRTVISCALRLMMATDVTTYG
jgi:hypothetical protein